MVLVGTDEGFGIWVRSVIPSSSSSSEEEEEEEEEPVFLLRLLEVAVNEIFVVISASIHSEPPVVSVILVRRSFASTDDERVFART